MSDLRLVHLLEAPALRHRLVAAARHEDFAPRRVAVEALPRHRVVQLLRVLKPTERQIFHSSFHQWCILAVQCESLSCHVFTSCGRRLN